MRLRAPGTLFLGTLLLAAAPAIFPRGSAGASPPQRPVVQEIPVPAVPGSRLPNLAAGADGKLYLSWVEPGERGGHALRFAVLEKEAWSEPRTIASGREWFVNWADFPSMAALEDGTLAAHWLTRLPGESFAYGIELSISDDGGSSWSKSIVPHGDRGGSEHGFVSIVPVGPRRFGLVWLDGRELAAEHAGEHASMTLRTVTVSAGGELGEERLLDDRVCECCQTSAAAGPGGTMLAVYRDRSEVEVRDISLVRLDGGGAAAPVGVHADGWSREACPVNGPAIAVAGSDAAVAWYTEVEKRGRVRVARSSNAGASFAEPIEIDDGNPIGRVDLVLLEDGSLLVSWLERVGDGAEVRLRRIRPDGGKEDSLTVARTSSGRRSGFPRLERAGKRIIAAWTAVEPVLGVHTAALVYPRDEEAGEPHGETSKE